MLHAETVGLFVRRASFQTGAGAAGALTLEWNHSEGGVGGVGVTACIYTTVLPSSEQGGGHMERKGLSSKGKLVAPEMLIL